MRGYTVITKDQIILKEPTEDGAFPNWRRVVPEDIQGTEVIEIAGNRLSKKPEVCEKISRMLWTIFAKAGQLVNLRYLTDLITGEWKLSYNEGSSNRPLVFNRDCPAGEAMALIMPIMVGSEG